MKLISTTILAALAALPVVQAHMFMSVPTIINNDDNNKNEPMISPGKTLGICRGHLEASVFAAGPVTKWTAGSKAQFTISGTANHGGGSCQASFSEDGGVTWKAVKTFIGNCPSDDGATYDFTVPAEIKAGDAIFAWTWFNRVGNREMYMNCAKVFIEGTGGSGLSEYSDMFIASNVNTCAFKEMDIPDIPVTGKGEIEPATKPAGLTTIVDTSSCLPAGKNPDPAFVPVKGGGGAPPAGEQPKSEVTAPKGDTVDIPKGDPVDTPKDDTTNTPKNDTVVPPKDDTVNIPKDDTVVPPKVDTPKGDTPNTPKDDTVVPPKDGVVPPKIPVTEGGSCTDGAISCPTETTWTMCTNGKPVPMGNVAPGTKCVGNAITKRAAIRFSGAHVQRRRA